MKFGVSILNPISSHGKTHQLKKTHLQFCKRYLEVSNKASNIACRAEFGRFSLITDINKRMLNYVTHLRNKDQDSIVKQSLLTSIDLHSHGKSSFYYNLINIYHYYDLPDFNLSALDNNMIKRHLDTMKKRSNYRSNYRSLEAYSLAFKKTRIL